MTMDVALDELLSKLKDEILEEPSADEDSKETDDQDEFEIENDFCINNSELKPVIIKDTSKNNLDTIKSSTYKWIPKKETRESNTLDQNEKSKDNKRPPMITLKRDKIEDFNKAIKPDQLPKLSTIHSRNLIQILEITQAKPTTEPAKPKPIEFELKNVAKPIKNTLIPIKVRVIKEKKETSAKDTNKQAELELQVKLLKELLDDALSRIPAKASQGNKVIEENNETTTTDIAEKQPKLIETQLEVTKKQPTVIEKRTKETEKRLGITKTQTISYDSLLSNKPTSSRVKRKFTENSDKISLHTADVPEKKPKLIETEIEQHRVTKNSAKRYIYEVTENQRKEIDKQPIKKANPFKNTANCVYYYEVTKKQLQIIERELKIKEAQPIITENPPKPAENLKVKNVEELLEPWLENTENNFKTPINADLDRENPVQMIDHPNTILCSKLPHASGAIMANKNINHTPIIKLKAENLKKIDYKQLLNITETNINKYIANAALTINNSNPTIQRSSATKKSQLHVKIPQIIHKSPIKVTLRHTDSPNGKSTGNTASVNIIANELVYTNNTNSSYINKACVPVINVRNSIQLDEIIKPTELNLNQTIDIAEDTFDDEILGHTEIVNDNRLINITDALESTAEVTIKDEVHNNDRVKNEVTETNEDSVQVMNVIDPLFIEPLNVGQERQRVEEESLKVKSIKAKPSIRNSAESANISPTYCQICRKANHKHEYLKCECRKEYSTRKELNDHKLKEYSVQTKPILQKQKKEFCRKCANVSLDNHKNIHLKCCGRPFCTRKSLDEHKLKDHPIRNDIQNQNTNIDERLKENHAESSNNVKATEDTAEAIEIDTQEDSRIEKTRIGKRNVKIAHSKSTTTLNEPIGRKMIKKRNSPYSVQCWLCQRIYPNLDTLNLHINTAHRRAQHALNEKPTKTIPIENNWTRHLIQKTGLFKCENCSVYFSQYPEKHYTLCKQNETSIRHAKCNDCNKKIGYNYNNKVQEIDMNHKFQHLFGYKLKTMPINVSETKIVTECPICRFHFFFDKLNLVDHIKDCGRWRRGKYECCGFFFDKQHIKIHVNFHANEHILLNYDLLINKRLEELPSKDEGSLITIDELKQLHTADSKIVYVYGDKYRVVSPKEYISLQAGCYQCRVCKYKTVSRIQLTQHQKKHVLSRNKASNKKKTSIRHSSSLDIAPANVNTASSAVGSLTCKLCEFTAGRRVELKFHQMFSCPARERTAQPTLTTQTVSVRETLRLLEAPV